MHILVVDDSSTMRDLLTSCLSQQHEVTSANDGEDGLNLASAESFDLVITDLNMPKMDGLTFARKLRECEDYRYKPILVLTTNAEIETKKQGKVAGVTGWIIKPFDPEQLNSIVHRIIDQ